MKKQISVAEFVTQVADIIPIEWENGDTGAAHEIQVSNTGHVRCGLVGYLNPVHPSACVMVGSEEIRYLDSLSGRQRGDTIDGLIAQKPAVFVLCDDEPHPQDLIDRATQDAIAVISTVQDGPTVFPVLQHYLSRALAKKTTLHGVFMEIFSIGVLITGEPGAGKSELALELLTRNHRLIADDAPEFAQITPDVIDGTCPTLLQDCLEVRGLGILNVRAMFGDSAIKPNKYLRLIVHLIIPSGLFPAGEKVDRLRGDTSSKKVLAMDVPRISIPVAPGRNLAVLVETAVRNHILRMKGFDAAEVFLERHELAMKAQIKGTENG